MELPGLLLGLSLALQSRGHPAGHVVERAGAGLHILLQGRRHGVVEGVVVVGSGQRGLHCAPGLLALYRLGGAGEGAGLFQPGSVHRGHVPAHGAVCAGEELVKGVVVGDIGLDSLIVSLLNGLNQGVYHLFIGELLRLGQGAAGG